MPLTNTQKAAIVLQSLDPLVLVDVLQHLGDPYVERINAEMATIDQIPEQEKLAALMEFEQAAVPVGDTPSMSTAASAPVAGQPPSKPSKTTQVNTDAIRKSSPSDVAALLVREHPMVCAVILSSLDTETASAVLSRLPEDLQGEVVYRLAIGQQPLPGVADEVKRIVASKLTIADQKPAGTFGSADSLADMLSFWKKEDADKVLTRIRDKNEQVTRNIESRILTFDNLFQKISDDKSIQKILRNVDRKDLALALRKAAPENAERVYKNMSQSAAQMLKEDMEAMGPQKLSIVEESQRKILDKVKRMLKDGEIVMSTGQEQEVSDLV